MSTNDFNRELARRIAGTFNGVEPRKEDLAPIDEFIEFNSSYNRPDAIDIVELMREHGWIVCPPLAGITTEEAGESAPKKLIGAPYNLPHPNNPCLCVVCRNRENIANGVTCAEVKIGGTCSD